jgi:RNA polymerase sigma-70 factor, ECF subfamily
MDSVRSTLFLQRFLADPKNHELFGTFVKKYRPRIVQRCLRCGLQDADAEDLAATILLRFCERDVFDHFVFQTKAKFYGWLDTVVRNDVLMFLRGRTRKPEAWSVGNTGAQEALSQATEEMVRGLKSDSEPDLARVEKGYAHVKAQVEERTWQAFCLLVFENRSVNEVSEQMGMSKNAVYAAKSRVARMLREELTALHSSTDGGK